jgi:hypothetical protein
MKKSLLRHLTRPIRSPIGTRHRCFRNGSKPDTSSVGPFLRLYCRFGLRGRIYEKLAAPL